VGNKNANFWSQAACLCVLPTTRCPFLKIVTVLKSSCAASMTVWYASLTSHEAFYWTSTCSTRAPLDKSCSVTTVHGSSPPRKIQTVTVTACMRACVGSIVPCNVSIVPYDVSIVPYDVFDCSLRRIRLFLTTFRLFLTTYSIVPYDNVSIVR
jgi:hypothetical protein